MVLVKGPWLVPKKKLKNNEKKKSWLPLAAGWLLVCWQAGWLAGWLAGRLVYTGYGIRIRPTCLLIFIRDTGYGLDPHASLYNTDTGYGIRIRDRLTCLFISIREPPSFIRHRVWVRAPIVHVG